jgi:hypothetical protein
VFVWEEGGWRDSWVVGVGKLRPTSPYWVRCLVTGKSHDLYSCFLKFSYAAQLTKLASFSRILCEIYPAYFHSESNDVRSVWFPVSLS